MNKTELQYIISITLSLMTGILLGYMYPIGRALLTGLFFAALTAALVLIPDDNDDTPQRDDADDNDDNDD